MMVSQTLILLLFTYITEVEKERIDTRVFLKEITLRAYNSKLDNTQRLSEIREFLAHLRVRLDRTEDNIINTVKELENNGK